MMTRQPRPVPPLPYSGEPDTTAAIPVPWLKPPVTATYRRPDRLARGATWAARELNPFAYDGTFGTTIALIASLAGLVTTQYAGIVA